jgi:hypothetical protein
VAEPGQSSHAVAEDPLPEAISLAQAAEQAGVGLKLLGGLAVRVLTPDLPPRLRAGQDIDFACLSKGRKATAAFLQDHGCQPDRRFNNLNGDRQMYFVAPSGRPIDVMVDRLTMCHVLDFRPGYGRLPLTLDAIDILLSKLQIFELNEKDARDIFQLLAGLPVGAAGAAGAGSGAGAVGAAGAAAPAGAAGGAGSAGAAGPAGAAGAAGRAVSSSRVTLDTERFGQLLGGDWGWWRTVTGNLDKLPGLAAEKPQLVPPAAPYDPLEHAAHLAELAHSAPKGMKWKLRANVGDRVRWYELPEEVGH